MLEAILLQLALFTSHEVVATTTTTPAPLVEREEITVSFGPASFEEFHVTHVSTPWAHDSMILVAPLGDGASWYESTDDYFDSLPARLAYFGTDVWIVEHRRGTEETLPLGSCPSPFPLPPGAPPPDTDCSAFGEWSVDDLIEDIGFVRVEFGLDHPTIGGHWTGGMGSVAAVDAEPEEYSGIVIWEGALYNEEPFTLAKNSAACAFLETIPDFLGASTQPADEHLVAVLAQANPDGLSPFPQPVLDQFFLTSGVATNLHVLHALLSVDNPALLDRPSEGMVFNVGTAEGGFDVTDIGQIFNIVNTPPAPTYASLGILRDYVCAFGGDSTYTSNLAAFEGDVLLIGSEHGLVDELQDTEAQFVNARHIQTDYRGDFGVNDLLWSYLREAIDLEIALFNIFAQL